MCLCRFRCPRGACLLCRPPTLPLALFLPPSPCPPSPPGKGGFLVFLCKGLRPLHPRDLHPRGTGSAGVSGACGGAQGDGCLLTLPPCPRRGACPVGRLLTLPSRHPAGGLPSLPPVNPAFSLLSFPHPPAPLPSGKGEIFTLFRRGLRPRHPGVKPLAALTVSAVHVPGGGACPVGCQLTLPSRHPQGACLLCRLSPLPIRHPQGGCALPHLFFLPYHRFSAPIPPPPFPSGEGGIFSFLMQGASPLASPRPAPARHWLGGR